MFGPRRWTAGMTRPLEICKKILAGSLRGKIPPGPDGEYSIRGRDLVFGHCADKIALMDDHGARHLGGLRGVEAGQLSIYYRRTENATVHHARPLDVAGIKVRAGDNVPRIDLGRGCAGQRPLVR